VEFPALSHPPFGRRKLVHSMPSSDKIPGLADLRRGRKPRAAKPVEAAPGLFDETPAIEPAFQAESARVWTVSDLVSQVRTLVERSYRQVAVEGEISNWRPAASGHCYFTLKDRDAQLSVVMFRREAALVRFKPKDGDAVRLHGQLSVYESRGQMQLIAESMHQVGLGALLAAVRELKERLRSEGLFERKGPLPGFPRCIGVVTSVQGAALQDIIKVCRRRHSASSLLIYPAVVQGPRCAETVAAGVRWFSAHPELADVVIVARGGGSWEELHGFDDEALARAIAACNVPVITGIGHATDSTIADDAADVCAPTPSAAAELVTAAQYRVEERVERLVARLERAGRYELLRARQQYGNLTVNVILEHAQDAVARRAQRIDDMEERLQLAVTRLQRAHTQRLTHLEARLAHHRLDLRLARRRTTYESLDLRLRQTSSHTTRAVRARIERSELRLEALNPLRVLERGYALVYGADGKLLRAASQVDNGEEIVARLARGRIQATVTGKRDE
jgi:exodeoxyribonuclease VII large subunit